MVRASASHSVDLGFISQVESYQKTKNGVHNLPALSLCMKGIVVEIEQASLLVVSLSMTLKGTSPFYSVDRWRSPAVYPLWWPV